MRHWYTAVYGCVQASCSLGLLALSFLTQSFMQPVPAPDYIVPVEIENNWHNFYVLKRPGVDNFLKKMGEIYEVVVFTASLSKVCCCDDSVVLVDMADVLLIVCGSGT